MTHPYQQFTIRAGKLKQGKLNDVIMPLLQRNLHACCEGSQDCVIILEVHPAGYVGEDTSVEGPVIKELGD